jgi:uncharacterized protein (TIGR02444 family)
MALVGRQGAAEKPPRIVATAMKVSALRHDNAFCRFSLTVYGSPGVADECLALQDALGIDVNLLLFCAWLGIRRIALTPADIECAEAVARPWHESAVRPLRDVRRQLKSFSALECVTFRTEVRNLELEAEQIEQAMLFAHALELWPLDEHGDPGQIVAANVELFKLPRSGNDPVLANALSTRSLIAASLKTAA